MERKLVYAASIWQLFTGFITLFFFSYHIKQQGNHFSGTSLVEQKGVQAIFNSLYSFTITFAMLFIVIGILNILFTRSFVKDFTIQRKMPICWIGLAILLYFLSDFISVLLLLIAAILSLAKNRSIKTLSKETESETP